MQREREFLNLTSLESCFSISGLDFTYSKDPNRDLYRYNFSTNSDDTLLLGLYKMVRNDENYYSLYTFFDDFGGNITIKPDIESHVFEHYLIQERFDEINTLLFSTD